MLSCVVVFGISPGPDLRGHNNNNNNDSGPIRRFLHRASSSTAVRVRRGERRGHLLIQKLKIKDHSQVVSRPCGRTRPFLSTIAVQQLAFRGYVLFA